MASRVEESLFDDIFYVNVPLAEIETQDLRPLANSGGYNEIIMKILFNLLNYILIWH
jgi:hypothetical protein